MDLGLHREPFFYLLDRESSGDGPRPESSLAFEANVIVEPGRPMLLDHEGVPRPRRVAPRGRARSSPARRTRDAGRTRRGPGPSTPRRESRPGSSPLAVFAAVRGSGVLGRGSSSSSLTPSASKAFGEVHLLHLRTPPRSRTSANRSHTLSIRKSCGSKPPSKTSSHVSGVETGARGSGRTEYIASMMAPWRFMLWSMNTLPLRSAVYSTPS